ncbi:MAG: hypothetical protein IT442_11125 [Phycisphaeraceae bacterium]|nr:hypothetical protein [Phycisphaeraceae bacterium]
MTRRIIHDVIRVIQRNGCEVRCRRDRGGLGVSVLDRRGMAESFFGLVRGREGDVARRMAQEYCSSEQFEWFFDWQDEHATRVRSWRVQVW